jgi:hypothetical protein
MLEREIARAPLIDERGRPILVMTWPAKVDDATFDELERFFERATARNERYGLLCDGRLGTGLPRPHLARVTEILARYAPLLGKLTVTAVVVENDVQRMALSAVNLFVPPPYPQRVFSNLQSARQWLEQELELR